MLLFTTPPAKGACRPQRHSASHPKTLLPDKGGGAADSCPTPPPGFTPDRSPLFPMITCVSISGLGPHRDFSADLHPRGFNLISGPSESGKSFIIEAIVFCLWGRSITGTFSTEAIHDGADKAEVELHLDSGRILRRSITRSRSQRRQITLADTTQSYSSEASFRQALGELTEDEEAVRVVIVPMAWQPLVSGNARKFRDLLMRLLPNGDVEGEVRRLVAEAGFECTDEESRLPDKEVMKRRASARRERDEAAGRLQSIQERLSALKNSLDEMADPVALSGELLARIEAWRAFQRRLDADERRRAAHNAQRAWDARRQGLGEQPQAGPDLTAARANADARRRRLQQARVSAKELYGRQQVVAAKLSDYGHEPSPSVCPTCSRPGWDEGVRAHADLVKRNDALLAELAEATTEGLKLRAASEVADSEAAEALEAQTERDRWRAALSALGARPELPDAPDDAPQPPPGARPTPDELAAAHHGAAAAGARQQRREDLESTAALLADATNRLARQSAHADRLHALLEAVRVAPSAVAAQMALALGDLGPVSLAFGDHPAVEVLIDGRPWWLASRGRQVVADGHLRAAMRRVMEMDHVLLILDNVQDVGGQPLPAIAPPTLMLRTNDAPGIAVKSD